MKSSYHEAAKKLLKEKWPTLQILEEEPIKVEGQTLYVDLYIPLLKIAVEVHGPQHYEFNSFFHKTIADFKLQQRRDRDKAVALSEKGIKLLEFKYNETEKWRKQLDDS